MNLFQTFLHTLKFILFTALLFVRPVIRVGCGSIAGLSLFCSLFIFTFMRHETTPLFAFLWIGLGMTAILWLYDVLIMLVAPDGFQLIITV